MRRWSAVLLLAVALTLLLGRWASMVYADWHWFDALGALAVYRSQLAHQAAWWSGAGLTAFAFSFLNFYALRRSILSLVLPRRLGNLEIGEAIPGPVLLAAVLIVSTILGVVLAAPAGDWTTFALARIAQPFREMDPYLDRDISYVVAWLPFELELHAWATRVMVVVGVLIVALYALTPSLRLHRGGVYVSAYCRRHLSTLAAVGLLLLAWGARLDGLSMTSIGADAAQPFGAYGFRVGLTLTAWTAVLSGMSAFLVFWAGWHGYARIAAFAALLACVGSPVLSTALPLLAQRSLSEAELREEDRPFAITRRLYTRRAFGVDAIKLDTAAAQSTAHASFASLAPFALGAPTWDPAALLRAAAGPREGSPSAELAWIVAPALEAIVVVGPRAGDAAHWAGERIDATATDERGRVLAALAPPPPSSALLAWEQPLVFDGATGFVVVSDTGGHIPAPRYQSLVERVAHAWNLRAPRLLATADRPLRPRIVFHRDVRERIATLVPFLTLGPTLAPIVRGDSLFWSVELYSTTATYPLSERLLFAGAARAYVHHAATAFVSAQTGRVTLVASAEPDAIMRTWMRRFPALFVRPANAPAALMQLRPPLVDWASIQATAFARTGVEPAPRAASRSSIGVDNADADLADGPPTLYAAPGTPSGLAWTVPLVDASGAVIGSVTSTGGPMAHTIWRATQRQVRWSEVLDRLQRTADSAGFGRQRRNPRRGRVLVIPVDGELLYAQAHYEWATESGPVLTGVSTEFAGVARAGAKLSEIIGGAAGRMDRGDGAFRAAVTAAHRRMNDAMRRGDWIAFGAAFDALGQLLRSPGR